ncbi:protein Jumonji isoform X3 [Vanessa atalanta]|uniref:protein Jumonji isoform X3 n=1 Tax=Vanessa atalanta TaxID=42275 RepID=UPI001FCD75CF|nr:protein Jumonji isoform X3 [Vanessa atalanta]
MKTKVQAQRKFAQGAYVPPSANIINTVINRRVNNSNGKPNRYFFRHNTSAGRLLDSISFEGIHTHKPVVVLERLENHQFQQVDNEPDDPSDILIPINTVSTKTQVTTVSRRLPSLRNASNRNSSCLCSRSRVEKKKIISKKKPIKHNYPLKRIRRKPTRNRKFYMKLRSARPASTVDTDFSIEDDKPLMFYTKKTKRIIKKQEKQQKVPLMSNKENPQMKQAAPNIQPTNVAIGASQLESTAHSSQFQTMRDRSESDVHLQVIQSADASQSETVIQPQPHTIRAGVSQTGSVLQPRSQTMRAGVYQSAPQSRSHTMRAGVYQSVPQSRSHTMRTGVSQSVPQSRLHTMRAGVYQSVARSRPHNMRAGVYQSVPQSRSHNMREIPGACPPERVQTYRRLKRYRNESAAHLRVAQTARASQFDSIKESKPQSVIEIPEEDMADDSYPVKSKPCAALPIESKPQAFPQNKMEIPKVCAPKPEKSLSPKSTSCASKIESKPQFPQPVMDRSESKDPVQVMQTNEKHQRVSVTTPCPDYTNKNVSQTNDSSFYGNNGIANWMCNSRAVNEVPNNDTAEVKEENGTASDNNHPLQTKTNGADDGAVAGPSTSLENAEQCDSPTGKKQNGKKKTRTTRRKKKIGPIKNSDAKILEAPVFRPNEEEFRDPIAYFQKIMPEAAKFGLCKVIAPSGFKPECTITDSIRFVVTNQYIARLYSRWGPVTRELCALRSFLTSQNITFSHAPLMEGLEVNLPKLLHFVQRQGGLKANVKSRTYVDTRKWNRLAEELNYTKMNNPAKKLDQIYVKYLLPYDALTQKERQDLAEQMDKRWSKRNDRLLQRAQNPLHRQKRLLGESDSSDDDDCEENQQITAALNEAEECVIRGRVMNLTNFKKIAKTALQIFFPLKPTTSEVESQYWKLVLLGNEHVCVNTASIDTGTEGYGFSKNKNEPYGKHPWNLKMLSQNKGNVLRSLGPVLGVTVPTLHVGMIYSTSCWHRDPHGLPWMEYMHTGPQKIWYGIPDTESARFRRAVESLCPTACQNKSIWLPSDIAMIPPTLLLERNVSMSRIVQKPGEYIIVFPKAYSCSICTGYTISESVYFATNPWVKTVNYVFQELRQSCEPTMFSLEQLLIAIARDEGASLTMLQLVHENFSAILSEELENRRQLEKHGLKPRVLQSEKRNAAGAWNVHENECEVCRTTLYLSRVKGVFRKKYSVCLRHALQVLDNKVKKIERRETETFEMEYFFTTFELKELISSVIQRLTKQPEKKQQDII